VREVDASTQYVANLYLVTANSAKNATYSKQRNRKEREPLRRMIHRIRLVPVEIPEYKEDQKSSRLDLMEDGRRLLVWRHCLRVTPHEMEN